MLYPIYLDNNATTARSRILEAIGLTLPKRDSTLRISLSPLNTEKDCRVFLSTIKQYFQNKHKL